MIYDSRDPQCPKGSIIDLDTGKEVEHAVRLDDVAGELLAPQISSAYRLWLVDPSRFDQEPPKYDAVPKNPKRPQDGYRLVLETRKGRFEFRPLRPSPLCSTR